MPRESVRELLGYPQWGEPYGIAGKWISRFYFADVRYGGERHLFVAVVKACRQQADRVRSHHRVFRLSA